MIMKLNEMTLERNDAIIKCGSLGRQFIEHFHKIVKSGKSAQDFNHHCSEMQNWWDDVRVIVLKCNKKTISMTQLLDWFLTAGSSVEIIIEEPYQDIYEKFCISLIANPDKKIKDNLSNLIN